MPGQARRLPCEERERPPPGRAELSLAVGEAQELLLEGGGRRPPVGEARQPLDVGGWEGQHLAELPDRHPRAERRERRDEGGVLGAVPADDLRDEPLPDVAGEVQVDVGHRRHVAVEKPPEEQPVANRVDVGQAGEVADDRPDRRSTPAARRQDPARRPRGAHLVRDLPGKLQDLAVQEEESGEVVVGDQLELLVQPQERLATLRGVGVAGAELVAADAGEGGVGVLAGGGEVGRAVAEVAGEVELEALREPDGLRDRGGMIGEPGGGIGRRTEDGVAVAASLAVGSVERQVAADRDERVLQERAARMVGVDVAGGDGRQARRLGEPVQIAGERPVPAGAGALKLDVDVAGAVDANEAPGSRLGIAQPAGGDEAGYVAVAGAAGQAHQAGRVRREVSGVERGGHGPPVRRRPGGGVGEGDEPAQVRVADAGLGQQGQVGAVGEGELRAGDRAHPRLLRRMGERERPAEPVMIGEGDRRVPVRGGLLGELLRRRCPVEEAERRMRV